MAHKPAGISFRILEIFYSIEESLYRFGIAPDFDDLGFFDFVSSCVEGCWVVIPFLYRLLWRAASYSFNPFRPYIFMAF
jgi:hypothetical protein